MRRLLAILALLPMLCSGCALIPDVTQQTQYHNPFPQLHKVAILPFFNLSNEPTVDGDQIALAYQNELQKIPGFEVVPVGVTKRVAQSMQISTGNAAELRKLGQALGVDAIVLGVVTDFTPYYPPRLGMAVRWYAVNPGFHPIPAGYGLPWGTSEEEYIPQEIVYEAEFELARQQLKTQTPDAPASGGNIGQPREASVKKSSLPETASMQGAAIQGKAVPAVTPGAVQQTSGHKLPVGPVPPGVVIGGQPMPPAQPNLPPDWPDPRGFVPPAPCPQKPDFLPQDEPIMTHVRTYNGNDDKFTAKLNRYYYYLDDARFGGWQSSLQRSDDFIRFCCYLHVTEMLASRGGAGESRVVWRWPIRRYER